MTARTSLIVDLEDAVQRGSPERRAETLRRITDLFLGSADRFTGEQVALFDDVMGRLIDRIETRALAELSRRLGPVANAPEQVLRRLARNDAIAGPAPCSCSRRGSRRRTSSTSPHRRARPTCSRSRGGARSEKPSPKCWSAAAI